MSWVVLFHTAASTRDYLVHVTTQAHEGSTRGIWEYVVGGDSYTIRSVTKDVTASSIIWARGKITGAALTMASLGEVSEGFQRSPCIYIRSWYSFLKRVPHLLVSFVTNLIVYESPSTTYFHIPLVLLSYAYIVILSKKITLAEDGLYNISLRLRSFLN